MVDTEKAIEQYKKHLQRLKAYNQTHKEVINKASRASFQKIKSNPEKYALYKEKKRQYYLKKKQQQNSEDSHQQTQE